MSFCSERTGEGLVRDSYGGIIRGDVSAKKLSFVFTGDEFGESFEPILKTLDERKIHGSFFVTGNFIAQPDLARLLKRAITDGHYVGPHSNKHPLYASWDDRAKSLITQADIHEQICSRTLPGCELLGHSARTGLCISSRPTSSSIATRSNGASRLDVTLFNFTPGSGSNRDYMRGRRSAFSVIAEDLRRYSRVREKGPARA